ncbi:MAG: hypothetical protein A3G75_15875, partial [Verrucomicrobia bacterium RIFCSPLOWO2_12_FULL_64_8]
FTAIIFGLAAGRYSVEIDVAELVHRAAGLRPMDVFFGKTALALNYDIFKEAGGYARAARITGTIDYEDPAPFHPVAFRFAGRKDAAIFNAIRVEDAGGRVVAYLNAQTLRAAELPGAEVVPEVKEPPIYPDPSQPLERRVGDLIRRMSLREKITQMLDEAPAIERLGVPEYGYWNECLHGVARAGTATVFPQAIAMAATWDVPLFREIAGVIGTEARAKYHDAIGRGNHGRYYGLTFWTPNINIFRDPRWGRGQETYGEDPFLTARLGVAFIQGLQGDDPRYYRAVACAKHFAVHSGPEPLRHEFDATPSERDFYDTYLPHFEAAVREGGVGAVMGAYNRVYGESASASPLLLLDLLRKQWGFQGQVVSDCGAINDIWMGHALVATPEEAVARAVKNGCDLECGYMYYALASALRRGLLTVDDIDRALRHSLNLRFRMGMLDPDAMVPYARITMAELNSPDHAALALQTARKSIALLKNTGALPLDRAHLKRLAVIGANADSVPMLLGNYNGVPLHPVTILQGIKDAAGPGLEVVHAAGGPLAVRPGEIFGEESPAFQEALAGARSADAVIFVGGIDAQLEGEEMKVPFDGFAGGDRTRIELPAPQTALLRALHATGKPVIFVNCSGSAIAMPWEADNL